MNEDSSSSQQGSNNDALLQGVLSANQLSYRLTPDLSCVVSRTTQSCSFQSGGDIAPSSSAQCVLNTGSSFVDLSRSFLILNVENTGSAASFGTFGSAANLLQTVSWTSRSGQVLERTDDCNTMSQLRRKILYDRSYLSTTLSMYNASATIDSSSHVPVAWSTGSVQRFCIPLSAFSEFAASSPILPPQLASGAMLQLFFAAPVDALSVASGDRGYKIKSARLELSTLTLSDSVTKALSVLSASSGLEVCASVISTTRGIRTASAVSLDGSKACSRALQFFYTERPNSTQADPSLSIVLNNTLAVSEYQSRVGNTYYPQSSVRGDNYQQTACELYARTLAGTGAVERSMGVSLMAYTSGCFAIAESLERTSCLTSGIPLSGSRLLNVSLSFSGTNASTPTLVNLFLRHQILARCFLSSTVVEL